MAERSRWLATGFAATFMLMAMISGAMRTGIAPPLVRAIVPKLWLGPVWQGDALRHLQNGRLQAAHRAAERAIAASPHDRQAVAILATIRLAEGRMTAAHSSFAYGNRLGWREPVTQIYLASRDVEAGRWAQATQRWDALLRLGAPTRVTEPLGTALLKDPAGRQATAKLMRAEDPRMARWLAGDPLATDALRRRAALLSGHDMPAVACGNTGPLVANLIDRGQFGPARKLWVRYCGGQGRLTSLLDPNFSGLSAGTNENPFGWRFQPSPEITMDRLATGANTRLVFRHRGSLPRPALQQLTALEPGPWRLATVGQTVRLRATVSCAQDAPTPPPSMDPGRAGQLLDVPACDGQRLTLWLLPGDGATVLDRVTLQPY